MVNDAFAGEYLSVFKAVGWSLKKSESMFQGMI